MSYSSSYKYLIILKIKYAWVGLMWKHQILKGLQYITIVYTIYIYYYFFPMQMKFIECSYNRKLEKNRFGPRYIIVLYIPYAEG